MAVNGSSAHSHTTNDCQHIFASYKTMHRSPLLASPPSPTTICLPSASVLSVAVAVAVAFHCSPVLSSPRPCFIHASLLTLTCTPRTELSRGRMASSTKLSLRALTRVGNCRLFV